MKTLFTAILALIISSPVMGQQLNLSINKSSSSYNNYLSLNKSSSSYNNYLSSNTSVQHINLTSYPKKQEFVAQLASGLADFYLNIAIASLVVVAIVAEKQN